MQSIPISDEAFTRAKRSAEANGLSLPDYLETLIIQDAESYHGQCVELTPEQIAKVEEGRADVAAGRVFTPDQVREHLRERHVAWLQSHPR